MNAVGLSFFFLCFISSEWCYGQSFRKGDNALSGTLSLGGYENHLELGGVNSSSARNSTGATVSFEHNLLDHIGIGGSLRLKKFHKKDSLIGKGSYQSYFFSNILHLINAKRVDLSLDLHYGPGYYKNRINTAGRETTLKAVGFNYIAGLRFCYFEADYALVLSGAYANYSLRAFSWKGAGSDLLDRSGGRSYNTNFRGLELGIGFLFRLNKRNN